MLLLGIWKNVEDLEEALSLPEIEAILSASREKEMRQNRFLAALKGIDLDKGATMNSQEKFDEVQRRVEAKLTGTSEQQLEMNELGLDLEIEE